MTDIAAGAKAAYDSANQLLDQTVGTLVQPLVSVTKEVVEPLFNRVGIGVDFQSSLLRRFFVFTLGSAAVIWFVKPDQFFDSSGNPREWSLSSNDQVQSTFFTWWVTSLLVGGFFLMYP